jgi:AraC family transcriptional regulator
MAVAIEEAIEGRRSFAWDAVAISEFRLGDSDLGESTAVRTSVLLQMSGVVEVELGTNGRYEKRTLRKGDFCLVPAGHSIAAARWQGERQIVLAELSPKLLRSVADAHELQNMDLISQQAIHDPQVTYPMLALREELLNGNSSGRAYADTMARAIAIRLLRAYSAGGNPVMMNPARGGLSRPLLRRVIDHIDENLDQDLGLRGLASISGLSEDHFARAFRESTGVPPHRYLLQRRLARAQQLLEGSDMPIAEIALSLGFADQSHLTNLFRRGVGMTPGQFRTQLGRRGDDHRNSSKEPGILQEPDAAPKLISQ